jgi:thioredoxin reductase (NADPH)
MLTMQADVIIVGGGPAGLQAGIYTTSEGFSTIVLEGNRIGGQIVQTPKLENFMGQSPNGISGPAFISKIKRQAVALGVMFQSGKVNFLECDSDGCKRILFKHNGQDCCAIGRIVILAVGVTWKTFNAIGVEEHLNKTFHYGPYRSMSVKKGGRYVVVGGGNSSGQAIVELAAHAERVTVLARSGFNTMSRYLIDRITTAKNIGVINGETISEVKPDGILTTGNEFIPCDHTFFASGMTPNTEWIELDKDERGFIKTGQRDLTTQTKVANVFCIGDARANVFRRNVGNAVADANTVTSEIFRFLG